MDLSVWLRMLYRWESTLEINRSIAEFMGLNPFKIFEAILKLHEACVVAMGWANLIYNPPNYHLWNYYLGSPCDGYDAANPYENISGVFGHMSYNDIAVGIRAIYLNMHTEEDQIKEDITQFRFVLKWLIETGWVLLQTDYYPQNWLDPNFMDHLHCAFSEKDLKFWRPENLDKEERENVVLTLSKLYHKIEVREFIYRVENRVIKYSEDKSKLTVGATDLETATTLLKILDVITILDVDFCKRRTKIEGLHYKA